MEALEMRTRLWCGTAQRQLGFILLQLFASSLGTGRVCSHASTQKIFFVPSALNSGEILRFASKCEN